VLKLVKKSAKATTRPSTSATTASRTFINLDLGRLFLPALLLLGFLKLNRELKLLDLLLHRTFTFLLVPLLLLSNLKKLLI
jgi:hypothetical protein